MIRLAMVSSIRPETNYTAYLTDALQRYCADGAEVLVYTEKDERNLAVPLKNVKLVWDRDWSFVFQILAQARQDKVDVVHLQHEINMYGGARTAVLFPLLVLLLRIFGFWTVVTLHAAIPIRLIDRRMLEVFNWPFPTVFTPVVRVVFPLVYFFIGLFSEKIIVHTATIKECLWRDYKIKGGKIFVVPHGVPDDVSYRFSEVSGPIRSIVAGRKFALYFGYLHKRKGIEYLISAFAALAQGYPDYDLIMAGGTIQEDYLKDLRELVARCGLERRITFTGFIKMTDLRYLMSQSEFVVLPAIYSIAASGPLAQVFAHEKPVIVTRIGSYAEEIRDGVNGLLAEPASGESLKEKMESLLSDSDLRHRLVAAVRQIHTDRAWSRIARETLAVYSSP